MPVRRTTWTAEAPCVCPHLMPLPTTAPVRGSLPESYQTGFSQLPVEDAVSPSMAWLPRRQASSSDTAACWTSGQPTKVLAILVLGRASRQGFRRDRRDEMHSLPRYGIPAPFCLFAGVRGGPLRTGGSASGFRAGQDRPGRRHPRRRHRCNRPPMNCHARGRGRGRTFKAIGPIATSTAMPPSRSSAYSPYRLAVWNPGVFSLGHAVARKPSPRSGFHSL